ncbi:hypothetical protein PENSPDRAFT_654925 [Peniophora sp. CONT]|nr:hypothetical protein PENSPDRAFT_654925 [Peniophora sp. CONT]
MELQYPFIPAEVVASSSYLTRRQSEMQSPSRSTLPLDDIIDTLWTMNVNELPVELLMQIFETARAVVPPSLTAPAAMSISHVCRRWRQAAIQCELLWSHLPLASEAWTKICLSRCATASLNILARDEAWQAHKPDGAARIVTLLTEELYRAQSLSVCTPENFGAPSSILPDVLQLLNDSNAPLLNDLLLSFRHYFPNGNTARAVRLDRPLFNGHLNENLHKAAFVDTILSLKYLTPFPNLQRLELINSRAWRDTAEFLATIRAFPQLEELVFIYDQDTFSARQFEVNLSPSADARSRCLPMRRMKKLVYHAPLLHVARIFSLVELPITASVILSYDHDQLQNGVVGLMSNLLANLDMGGLPANAPADAPAEENAPVDPIVARSIRKTALCAHFAGTEGRHFSALMLEGRELCARITNADEQADLPASFHMTIPTMGPDSIEHILDGLSVFLQSPSLTIKPPRPPTWTAHRLPVLLDTEVWRIFELFSSIGELTLHGNAVSCFIECYKSVGPSPAFPNLERLRICDVDLAQGIVDPETPKVVFDDLFNTLFRSRRVSELLKYLVIERCTINEADEALLREGVESELNMDGAELELIGCTIVTGDMVAEDHTVGV